LEPFALNLGMLLGRLATSERAQQFLHHLAFPEEVVRHRQVGVGKIKEQELYPLFH
jgi:hypothetical protein